MDKAGLEAPSQYEVIVIGAGIAGVCQLYHLVERGVSVTVLDTASDVGGTWYYNRYPGCRFDTESYTYGYSFSQDVLQTWDWKERFSPQPENLRYVNYVVDKFDLRRYMQFNCKVERMDWNDDSHTWTLHISDGRQLVSRYVVAALGLLSAPTLPRVDGIETFRGRSFHTYYWPQEPLELEGRRVAVIGTGATGVQVIAEIADKVSELTVFQRRPNWCAPLSNGPIPPDEMADIKSRYDEIFEICRRTPGGMIHEPDRRGFHNVSREERLAKWEELYGEPGFAIWLQNFREIFMEEEANAEFSEFIADKIRGRVHDPELAEKLIPRDHGFGVQRIPMETNYYEAYNRENVNLVELEKTPIERVTPTGIVTTEREYEFDVIVYATGFDALTGPYDRIDIRGVGGERLRDKWGSGPVTLFGLLVHNFPNFQMIAGPQSGSASTNFARGIEWQVEWLTSLLDFMWKHGYTRFDPTVEAEEAWVDHVRSMYGTMLMRKAKSWFTGYNSNLDGHEYGKPRYLVYNGGSPKFQRKLREEAEAEFASISFR